MLLSIVEGGSTIKVASIGLIANEVEAAVIAGCPVGESGGGLEEALVASESFETFESFGAVNSRSDKTRGSIGSKSEKSLATIWESLMGWLKRLQKVRQKGEREKRNKDMGKRAC